MSFVDRHDEGPCFTGVASESAVIPLDYLTSFTSYSVTSHSDIFLYPFFDWSAGDKSAKFMEAVL